jgi:hypothetical protein
MEGCGRVFMLQRFAAGHDQSQAVTIANHPEKHLQFAVLLPRCATGDEFFSIDDRGERPVKALQVISTLKDTSATAAAADRALKLLTTRKYSG